MSEQDCEKIKKMPRQELNSEVLHCWQEQKQYAEQVTTLRSLLTECQAVLEFCRIRSIELQNLCKNVKELDNDYMEEVITAFEIQAREMLGKLKGNHETR